MEATRLKRGARVAAGFLMLIAGLALVVLPIVPGWWLVIPGLALLAREFHWARRLQERIRRAIPRKSTQS